MTVALVAGEAKKLPCLPEPVGLADPVRVGPCARSLLAVPFLLLPSLTFLKTSVP